MRFTKSKIKYVILFIILASFAGSFIIPGNGGDAIVQDAITFIGILFGIIVGFFIADLYTRYSTIRSNAAADSSSLSTFYLFAVIIAKETGDTQWLTRVEDRIEQYVHHFMPLGWEDYHKTEKDFTLIGESLKELQYRDSDKANEAFSNILNVYNGHSTARENLVMFGRDKLSWGEWLISLFLGVLLLVCLFYTKNDESLISVLFTGAISSAVLLLFVVLRDLDNLNFGENEISIEPYERVLDAIDRPRYHGRSRTNEKDTDESI